MEGTYKRAHKDERSVMTAWEALPTGVTWTDSPLVSFEMSRADLESVLGAPQLVDLDSNGVGAIDVWAMRFTCGLEVTLWIYKMRPDGSMVTDRAAVSFFDIYSNEPDEDHVLFHMPLKISVTWRHDRDRSTVAQRRWHLLRQDDNGNRFEIRSFSSQCEAECAAQTFEERGHKQTYWIECDKSHSGFTKLDATEA